MPEYSAKELPKVLLSATRLLQLAGGSFVSSAATGSSLDLVQGLPAGGYRRTLRLAVASLLLAATLWAVFHAALGLAFPPADFSIPPLAGPQCGAILTLGATASLGLAGFAAAWLLQARGRADRIHRGRQPAAQAESENLRLRQLAESTFEALLVHRDGLILEANTAFCTLTGLPLDAVLGEPICRFLPSSHVSADPSDEPGRPSRREAEIAKSNGTTVPVEYLSREISFLGGAARVTALRDISERRAAEQQVRFLAEHDVLTGLPNRAKFRDIITRQLIALRRDDSQLAVFFIDLDRFKIVNDTLGHKAGDTLLRQVAERIQNTIRATDVVARIGGDEFLLLGKVSAPDWAAPLAERLVETLGRPFDLDGKQAMIGASIGIAIAPDDGTDPDVLINHADLALYQCKANGRGQYAFFEPGVQAAVLRRREMERAIARTISEGGFSLDLQPIFGGSGALGLSGFEALLRWQLSDGSFVSPAEFIPVAEESGLIGPLGAWVLRAACLEAASWTMPCRIAVNVSPRQLVKADFVSLVTDVLRETGLPASRLEIEITETVLVEDASSALDVVRRLKRMGIHVALDDFGTGYSSLSYLQRFPFDKVKIDRSFVQPLETSVGARAIVRAILAMCEQLQIDVVAEGVETEGQLQLLRASGCELFQGYLLGRAIPREDVPAFLASQAERAKEAVFS